MLHLKPLVPAEPDESVSARVAAICRYRRSSGALVAIYCDGKYLRDKSGLQANSIVIDEAQDTDDVPTKVEVPR